MASELLFAPLGGVGEIGMNLALYGIGDGPKRQWIAVDLGVSFAGDDLPGVDLIMPDIAFLIAERRNLLGLVLTHAHEDHFGALLDLWPRLRVPVYATPFTASLFVAKRLGEPGAPDIPVNVVPHTVRSKHACLWAGLCGFRIWGRCAYSMGFTATHETSGGVAVPRPGNRV